MEAVMKKLLRDPIARAAPWFADPSERGIEQAIVAARPVEPQRKIAIGALMVIGLFFVVNAVAEGLIGLMLIASFMLALALFITWIVIAAATMQWHVTWLDESVRVSDRRWAKSHEWTAPYGEFRGVKVDKLVLGNPRVGGVGTALTYHYAQLDHEDPDKSVLLASHFDHAKVEEAAAKAEKVFGLPRI